MSFKTTALAFAASLAVHTMLVTCYFPAWEGREDESRTVEISYLHYSKEAPQTIPSIKYPPVIKKEAKIQKIHGEKYVVPQASESRPVEMKPERMVVSESIQVKNAGEFLSDPQKGKAFLNYFGLVKQRVHRMVEQKYKTERMSHGDVSLVFILKADGTVVNVYPIEKNSSADEWVKDFAVRCVRDCSPFPRFPKELGMQRISFNLSILFNET
ncbi:MAG: hypothetical protein AUJ72_02155 [Candidatus Omnitrophica bacterium CG1_02_46_14]|nr:MAG: hypothetical protein AUJ72_02155 [Candidatus Omnitrophica bacterium CG1_02_46_14]